MCIRIVNMFIIFILPKRERAERVEFQPPHRLEAELPENDFGIKYENGGPTIIAKEGVSRAVVGQHAPEKVHSLRIGREGCQLLRIT